MASLVNVPETHAMFSSTAGPVPMENVRLAAEYLRRLFATKSVCAAFIGGWAMHLRGSERRTYGVDLVVECDSLMVVGILCDAPRLIVPIPTPASSIDPQVVRFFVNTGGNWDNHITPVITERLVLAKIYFQGDAWMPPNVYRASELSVSQTRLVPERILDFNHQLSGKLSAFFDRKSDIHLQDVVYLIKSYQTGRPVLQDLDWAHCNYFLKKYIKSGATEENVDMVKKVLELE